MIPDGLCSSDALAGYVVRFDVERDLLTLKTSDGRVFDARPGSFCYAEVIRNLGEGFLDCTGQMRDMLIPGRFVYLQGLFFPEPGEPFEIKHIVFAGRAETEFVFEKPDFWVRQIQQLGDFYFKAQFGDGPVDYSDYRTQLDLYGRKMEGTRQETDTISRLVYGFATAFLLTGEDRFLEAAEAGTTYLRKHFCAVDAAEGTCYWYHAVDFSRGQKILGSSLPEIPGMRRGQGAAPHERKMLGSESGDDFDAIPAYEQIYALAGPTQTYRVTGDPRIRQDIDRTLNLFDRYFRDHEKGGYFSHVDPVTFDPRAESLGRNRARKNWNSVGDHAPAYLINLYLATGEEAHLHLLVDTATTIATRFPDYEYSPFVQEKFHEDWSPDRKWGWQQDRAVVGHNLKIAWNLMRVFHVNPDERYLALSRKIAALMPQHGGDGQRGGWYDVVERVLRPGQKVHRFAWHDRKAWWQQEQGILAYYILAGSQHDAEYLRLARESAAFYAAWFLDHDSGGVYFNVRADGTPYLLGTERLKGSHSMSGYHSFELAYLCATYINLLVAKHPLDLHFKPQPGAFGGTLRVAPDLLPEGSVRIDSVTADGAPYTNFDPVALTVKVPASAAPIKLKVRIVPTSGVEHFQARLERSGDALRLVLSGELDARALATFRTQLDAAVAAGPARLELDVRALTTMVTPAARALVFAKQKLDIQDEVRIVGANAAVRTLLENDEFAEEVELQ